MISQHDERDCGAACLAMIADYYGHRLPIARCRELTKTDRLGTNMYGMVDGAKKLGFLAEALQGTPEELFSGLEEADFHFPFIAHIITANGMFHYVVLYGIHRQSLLVADPAKGKYRLSFRDFAGQWTGNIIVFEKTEGFRTANETRHCLSGFFCLLRGQRAKLMISLVLSLLTAGMGIAGSLLFRLLLDQPGEWTKDRLSVLFPGLIGLYLLQALIQYIRGRLIARVSQKVDVRLSLAYYEHLLGLPASSLGTRQTGEYLSRFSDASRIQQAVSTTIVTIALDVFMILASGIILFRENVLMFAVTLITVSFYAAVVILWKKPMEQSNRTAMESGSIMESFFKETIDGSGTIKAVGAEPEICQQAAEQYQSLSDSLFHNEMVSLSRDTLTGTAELIGSAMILWIGFIFILQGRMTIGGLLTFSSLQAYFMDPVKNLVGLQPIIQSAMVAAERLHDILDLQTERQREEPIRENSRADCAKEAEQDRAPLGHVRPQTAARKRGRPGILNLAPMRPNQTEASFPWVKHWQISHLSFRYGNRSPVLQNVSFRMERGQRVALVGESGCGKTTLAKLLLRFYEPESGCIAVDGTPISHYGIQALRRSIACVPQNTELFSGTIRSNLLLGNPSAAEEELNEALRLSHAEDFIRDLPMGLDTPVEEKGANLSGGQRQRLSIARALLRKPQLLILDEATSSLDSAAEAAIMDTIYHSDPDMTCIIIAHRLTTIRNCDLILVMDHGRIVERGTHPELILKDGTYASLWKKAC